MVYVIGKQCVVTREIQDGATRRDQHAVTGLALWGGVSSSPAMWLVGRVVAPQA